MNNFYSTGAYKHDPTTFGGYVYEYDYDGYLSMSEIAGRILADMNFDKQCRLNAVQRDKYKKNKPKGRR